jgi:hypothetical protein
LKRILVKISERARAFATNRLTRLDPIDLIRLNEGTRSRDRFALLTYTGTNNLGDEIQSLAALSFLPHVTNYVDREQLSNCSLKEPHKIILNGWYSHRPSSWPPSESLRPLIVSFHASDEIFPERNNEGISFSDRLREEDSLAYMHARSPIGTRDLHTSELLNGLGIPAFFSGCLTLTLTQKQAPERRRFACVNDMDAEVSRHVRLASGLPVVRTAHSNESCKDPLERMDLARDLLAIYAHASFVVTSRLHCALPCLALGTPVLFCPSATDTYRFSGLNNLVRTTSRKELLSGRAPFDFREPTPNSSDYIALRESLIRRCNEFVHADT